MKSEILLVEDDALLLAKLSEYLRSEGFAVKTASSYQSALEAINSSISLALIDWSLPDGEGIDLVRSWSKLYPKTPLLILSANAQTTSKVVGLQLGAFDYITKPFEPIELLARINAHLRLANSREDSITARTVLQNSGILLCRKSREVRFHEMCIELTKKQFDLVELFLLHPQKVFCRDELLNLIWGYDSYPTTRTVDNHIAQLRQKFAPELFETLHGIGYRFKGKKT